MQRTDTDLALAIGERPLDQELQNSGLAYSAESEAVLDHYNKTIFVLETGKKAGEIADTVLLVNGLATTIAKHGAKECIKQLAKEHAKDYVVEQVADKVVGMLLDVADVPQDVRDVASQAMTAVRAARDSQGLQGRLFRGGHAGHDGRRTEAD